MLSPYAALGINGESPDALRRMSQYFLFPEYQRLSESGRPIEQAFNKQMLEPGAGFGEASRAASGLASQLFAPGGEIATMIARARGKTIGSGFAPSGAVGAENNILRAGTQRVGDMFAQQAGQLEGQRMNLLGGAYGDSMAARTGMAESMFTAEGSAQQLNLANRASRRGPFGLW